MPDLRGQSAREALRTLTKIGAAARMTGRGVVIEQTPAAGEPLATGEVGVLRLGRYAAGGHAGRGTAAMTLGVLLQEFADRSGVPVPPLEASVGTPVSSIAYDSRKARAGSVFVALRGVNADGTAFAREAIGRGAIAALSESAAPADVSALWVQVPDARLALAALSAIFHDDPSERLILVGITGTNGKTTTSYLLASIFEAAGIQCGRIGTVGYRIGRKEIEAERTTPEAPELQAMLREMVNQGCGACVMEVSSHALALKRVDYLRFAAGDLHESHARSPRLPPQHGRLLRRQAAPLRAVAGAGGRGGEPRRSSRRGADRASLRAR